MKLLLKPRWMPGESWPGYLLRLAEANQLGRLAGLGAGLNLRPNELLMADPASILDTMGVDAQGLPPADPPVPGWMRTIPFRAGRSGFTSWCSLCLRDDSTPHFRALWDLPLQLTCEVHECQLERVCPSCGQDLTVLRKRLLYCDCGRQLATVPPRATSSSVKRMQQIFTRGRAASDARSFAAATNEELLGVQLLRWLAQRSEVSLQRPKRMRMTHAWLKGEELARVIPWFEDWPHEFERRYANLDSSRVVGRGKRSFRSVCRIFSELDSAIANLKARSRRMRRPKRSNSSRTEFVGIRRAMELTGMHYEVIRRWIDQGLLGEVKIQRLRSGQHLYEIPAEAVSQAAALTHKTDHLRHLAGQVGLSTSALNKLVGDGLLRSISLQKSSYTARLQATEVFELTRKLRSSARGPVRTAKEIWSLSRAIELAHRRGRGAVRALIAAISEGRIDLHLMDPLDIGLASASVKKIEFRDWLAGLRS